MSTIFRRSAIAIAILLTLLVTGAQAAPIGNIRSIDNQSASTLQAIQIKTDSGALIEITLQRPDVFRIQAGPKGVVSGPGDRASPIVIKQYAAKVDYTLSDTGDHQLLRTSAFALRIYKKPLRFALYKADNVTPIWQELQPLELGDKATVQTLASSQDEHFFGGGQQNGAFEFKGKTLEVSYSGGWEEGDRPNPAPFYMSTHGYGVLRNTWSNGSYDFRANEFLSASHQENRFDAYYFVGDSPAKILSAYTELTGRAKLLPRWGYEFGDADCYNDHDNVNKPGTVPSGWSDGPTGTTPDVINSVAVKYREFDMPGGWILPNDGYGCGYTDLPKVVQGLKPFGFHTGLWTENGVDKIAWEVGHAGTRVQKLDVAWTGNGYQFALDANMAAADGILKNSDSRPFVWTVMGWAGIQRYAVTWTGDQSGSWDYIRWHIPTLIGSGLSGQVYATGDVDGIFGGSPETYTRDLQWKSFTPVLMGMSGWSKAERKHPWWFEEPYRSINRNYLKLKMRLMPYMYTAAWQAEQTGAPIIRGLMWDHPADPHAFSEDYKYQFFLGQDFLVAPIFRSQASSKGWRRGIYLPEGQWIDYRDGRVIDADHTGKLIDYAIKLDTLPVFIRAGAIIPMYPAALYDGQVAKDTLTWDIYPYGESHFSLYEDDGNTRQYQDGKFSQQQISVSAPSGKAGDIHIRLDGVSGSYQGQESQRTYVFQVHTRVMPQRITLQNVPVPEQGNRPAFDAAASGWYYDAQDKYGVIYLKTGPLSIREGFEVLIHIDAGARLTSTAGYPAAPDPGRAIPADSLLVINRPAEEPGNPLENALNEKPGAWFRTLRDQSVKTGPHEFVLSLGERRMINGFQIAPRTDEHWKYGQPKDVEVYLSDNNGDWGKPVYTGQLKLKQGMQTVEFEPHAGKLMRFRVMSTFDQTDDSTATDPMVLAASGNAVSAKPFNVFIPNDVTPITLSAFRVLEYTPSVRPRLQSYLSDTGWVRSENNLGVVAKDHPAAHKASSESMVMNGLHFRKGLGVGSSSRVDYQLDGDWQLFRADIGIDDRCRTDGGLQFQVYGDDRLLYDSGLIQAPAVVKPELDIRGLHRLSLRTLGATGSHPDRVCANWANALLVGFQGDKVGN